MSAIKLGLKRSTVQYENLISVRETRDPTATNTHLCNHLAENRRVLSAIGFRSAKLSLSAVERARCSQNPSRRLSCGRAENRTTCDDRDRNAVTYKMPLTGNSGC